MLPKRGKIGRPQSADDAAMDHRLFHEEILSRCATWSRCCCLPPESRFVARIWCAAAKHSRPDDAFAEFGFMIRLNDEAGERRRRLNRVAPWF
jgi:hypothetical protein